MSDPFAPCNKINCKAATKGTRTMDPSVRCAPLYHLDRYAPRKDENITTGSTANPQPERLLAGQDLNTDISDKGSIKTVLLAK